MLEGIIDLLKKLLALILAIFGEGLPEPDPEPEPEPEPVEGPYMWILNKYGDLMPKYFPDSKYSGQKALWQVKDGVIDHKIYEPTYDKKGNMVLNDLGGIVFGTAVKDVRVNEGQVVFCFRQVLQAGTQANGGKGVQILNPYGSVIQFEVMDYLGYIDDKGFLIKE